MNVFQPTLHSRNNHESDDQLFVQEKIVIQGAVFHVHDFSSECIFEIPLIICWLSGIIRISGQWTGVTNQPRPTTFA